MTLEEIMARGRDLVHRSLCPACDTLGNAQSLQRELPAGFHWHGMEANPEVPYLFCPVDGQGYRITAGELRILPVCNGGMHADGRTGFLDSPLGGFG